MTINYTNRSKSQLLEEIQRLHTELTAVNLMTEKRTTALYISEERFSLAMRGANDGLWDWNLESDEVYYSPRWKSMLGYGENELDNDLKTWVNLVQPDDKDRVLEKVQDYLDGQADSFEV
ncbi:MAG: PAS domain-containing protein, partial [Nitrosomonas sp.]|nr:PAS domain-containing protein [Nitrosomonas sp.]